jgi:hypothetical protein
VVRVMVSYRECWSGLGQFVAGQKVTVDEKVEVEMVMGEKE